MVNEQGIYSGNGMRSHVKAVETFRLVLKSSFILDLANIFYVPSFSRNLVSVIKNFYLGFGFNFNGLNLNLMKDNSLVGNGFLVDGLYRFSLNPTYENNLLTLHDGSHKVKYY